MKIETFVKGSVVVLLFFVLGLTLMGEGILQQEFDATSPPAFGEVSKYNSTINNVTSSLEDNTLSRDTNPDQSESEGGDFIEYSWLYIGKALKAVSYTVTAADSSQGSITEVLNYLNVNPLITGGILTIIVLSFAFALVAWWKSRRA